MIINNSKWIGAPRGYDKTVNVRKIFEADKKVIRAVLYATARGFYEAYLNGERIGDRETIEHIYESWREFFKADPSWSLFALTPDKSIEEKVFGRPADRRRKLFNGRMEVCYYQFHGEKL